MDDYGVEEFDASKLANEEKKEEVKAQPAAQAQPAAKAQPAAAQIDSKSKGASAPQTKDGDVIDEENLYAEPKILGEMPKDAAPFVPDAQRNWQACTPTDTFFSFIGQEFLYHSFTTNTWGLGQATSFDGSSFAVPEHSAVVRIGSALGCDHSKAFILGGVDQSGNLLNWAMGIDFKSCEDAGLKHMKLVMSYSDAGFLLPNQRMMHQACLVADGNGGTMLLVMGGKEGNLTSNCAHSDTVIAFDMKCIFEPWLKTADADGPEGSFNWKSKAKMNSARANFASMVLDNFVYVFGGIKGRGEGENAHMPTLATVLAEKYDPATNEWTELQIEGGNPIAAFGWTPLASDTGELLILGGTDGDVLQDGALIINFKTLKAQAQEQTIDSQVAESKMVYRSQAKKIYNFGGFGTGGQNFMINHEAGAVWEECERTHVSLLSGGGQYAELAMQSSLYFE